MVGNNGKGVWTMEGVCSGNKFFHCCVGTSFAWLKNLVLTVVFEEVLCAVLQGFMLRG